MSRPAFSHKQMSRLTWPLSLILVATGCNQQPETPTSADAATPSTEKSAAAASVTPGTAAEHLAESEKCLKKGDHDAALKSLNAALKVDSKCADAYVRRAAILAEHKYFPLAINDITAALNLRPEDPRLFNTRGYFFLTLKEYDLAANDFADAINIDMEYAQPHNNRGLTYIAQGKFKEAVSDFDAALRIDEKYLDALNNRGFALMQAKKYDDAIETLTRAIEIDPKYINAWNNRATTHRLSEKYAEAVEDYTQAIKLQPTNLQFYSQRSECNAVLGKHTEAKADTEHVAWAVQLAEMNRELAKAEAALNSNNSSEQPSQRDPAKEHKFTVTVTQRGRHFLAHGELKLALEDFERVLKVTPDHPMALVGRAAVRTRDGKLKEAMEDLAFVMKGDAPLEAYSLRGDVYYQQGELDRAIEDYEVARRMDSQVARAYQKRGELRRTRGDQQRAQADFEQASMIDPSINGVQTAAAVADPKPAKPKAKPAQPQPQTK